MESLRGFAAILIALMHAGTNFAYNSALCSNQFIRNCHLMVDFFFVLSGFVIAYNYYDRITDPGSLWRFQARRFLRLYPLHLLTLLAFVGVQCSRYVLLQYWIQNGIAAPDSHFDFGFNSLIHNLLLTHSILQDNLSFNSPSWSISVEFYTYSVFAVGMFLIRGKKLRPAFTVVTVLVGACYFLSREDIDVTNGHAGLIRCLYSFSLGVLIYSWGERVKRPLPAILAPVLLIICLILIYFSNSIHEVCFPPACAAFLFAMIHSPDNGMKHLLSHHVLVSSGTLSYGVYMWHSFIWFLIARYFMWQPDTSMMIHPDTGFLVPDVPTVTATLLVFAGMTVVFAISWISYKYVESPVNNLRHRL